MKKVSVIIPVYNAEKTICRCVESILFGSYKNVEIILIDDFSKDDSWKICKQLCLKYTNIKLIKNNVNSGVSYTRNRGIEEATGDYIVFVDSDDWCTFDFINEMYNLFVNNEDSLIITGFCYYNIDTYNKTIYTYNNKNNVIKFVKPNLFEIQHKQLLNSLWNKIFLRKLIIENKIRFDEHQSMGEDLKFILDYIRLSNINNFYIINLPLYYYTYSTKDTLLSNFGWNSLKFSINNIMNVSNICKNVYGLKNIDNITVVEIENLKRNFIYHILNNKNKTKSEKKDRLKEIIDSKDGKRYLKDQKIICMKNRIINSLNLIKCLITKLQNFIYTFFNKIKIMYFKNKLKQTEFSIISQNCIGGVFYHDMELRFNTPTINLYFDANDFIKFISNLEYYLSIDIIMRWGTEYPIGILDDLTVQFMHYDTCSDAIEAWQKRKNRIKRDKILVICTDMAGFDDSSWEEWKKISYPKILYTANTKYIDKNTIYYKKYRKNKIVKNLIPHREFYKNSMIVRKINEL